MNDAHAQPQVGTGVIIVNGEEKILVGKRQGAHSPFWSILGGKVDIGETFEETAVREVKEESNIDIKNPKVVVLLNDLDTYRKEGKHFISIILLATEWSGEPMIMEPGKCAEFRWVDPRHLPEPHFDASRKGVACWLEGVMYKG